MAEACTVHEQVVAAVREVDLETLWRPTRELVSDTREARRDVPFIEALMSDACTHFDEHREYIEQILAS